MSAQHACTSAVHAGINADPAYGAVVAPVYLSSNYALVDIDEKRAYDYSRSDNPSRAQLAQALAKLEGGAGAQIVASGMAAASLALALVPANGRVIVSHDCYGGTWRLLHAWADKQRFELVFVNFDDAPVLSRELAKGCDLVWIETPSNPLLHISDIQTISAQAHQAGALCLVDNTFLSPCLQQPISLGADLVLHSTTKYINGHSDVVGGALIAKTRELADELAWWSNCNGLNGAPFDSYLILRGLRSLYARMKQHESNAVRIAAMLEKHPEVERVNYPGLASHPQHRLACQQQQGFGAMLSFELKGGIDAVRRFVGGLRHFTLAESLGGVESLIAYPATMTHAAIPAQARREAGISDGLLRLSVGIEHVHDLLADLDGALAQAAAKKSCPLTPSAAG